MYSKAYVSYLLWYETWSEAEDIMVTQNDPRSARGDIFYPLYFIIFYFYVDSGGRRGGMNNRHFDLVCKLALVSKHQ